jgi:hypothetical protein
MAETYDSDVRKCLLYLFSKKQEALPHPIFPCFFESKQLKIGLISQ